MQVAYSTDCISDPEFAPTKLWLWDEEARTAASFPLPGDAVGPLLSADQTMIVFRRHPSGTDREIWVMDSDGQNERMQAAIPLDKIRERYPGAVEVDLEYGWVQDTHTTFYQTRPLFDLEQPPFDTIVLTDAETGESTVVVPTGEIYTRAFSPDGKQLAALALGEVRLIHPENGTMQSVIPLSTTYVENPLSYSPDGRFLTVLTENGVAFVDTATGSHREALFEYLLWGAGDSFLFMSPFYWRDASTVVMLVAPPFEVDEQALDVFTELLDWEFGVYLLNASQATVSITQSFRGTYPSAKLSSDLTHLAYERAIRDSETRELYVADLLMGIEFRYATGNQISFINWAPDSIRFFYAARERGNSRVYLGQLGQAPIPFDIRPDSITWLDNSRFVARPGYSGLELHLYTISGGDILIASIQPDE